MERRALIVASVSAAGLIAAVILATRGLLDEGAIPRPRPRTVATQPRPSAVSRLRTAYAQFSRRPADRARSRPPETAGSTPPAEDAARRETEAERDARLAAGTKLIENLRDQDFLLPNDGDHVRVYSSILDRLKEAIERRDPHASSEHFEGTILRHLFYGDWHIAYEKAYPAAWAHIFSVCGVPLDDTQIADLTTLVWFLCDEGNRQCDEIEANVIDPWESFGDASWDLAWDLEVAVYQELYEFFLVRLGDILERKQRESLQRLLDVSQLRADLAGSR